MMFDNGKDYWFVVLFCVAVLVLLFGVVGCFLFLFVVVVISC